VETDQDLEPGTELSHYRIVSKIGAGGMGAVYLADDTKLERQVALKVLLPEVATDEDRVRRFLQEAKSASALNHPNILTVFEIGTSGGHRYIATEFIKGETLRDRIKRESLKLKEALNITLQVAAALGAAHEAGIIHRDVKPENIMIRDDGLVKVLDFGLAKLSGMPAESVDTTLPQFNTDPGTLVGTVAYMSPEQARGRKLDPRSDIFSLGIVMFEIFTGRRPFDGESHLDLISSILKDDAPSLRQFSPNLPRQLERIVDKTLRKDRDNRYQHVRDLHIDIEDLREELKFEAKLNQSVQPTLMLSAQHTNPSELRSAFTTGLSKTRRFTLLHALIFLAVVGGVVGAVIYFLSGSTGGVAPGSYKTSEVATWNSAPGELFSSASFSPDGKLIAFASTKSGSKNVWVTQTGSTEAIQITNDAFPNTDPIWSPKGDEIAYLSERPGTGGAKPSVGIWKVPALGGTPRFVGPLNDRGVALRRWTPTGNIYYDVAGSLFSLNVSDGSSQRISPAELKNVRFIDIASDEKSLAYTVQEDKTWRLITTEVSGGRPQEVAAGEGKVEGFAWLSAKNRIYYSASFNDIIQVFVTEVGSARSTRLTASETDSGVVDASQDGRSIIVSSAKEESNLWRASVGDAQEAPIARDLNVKLAPTVSPDGSRIAFQSVRKMTAGNKLSDSQIIVKTAKPGSDSDRGTTVTDNGFLPAWSPDGAHVAFLRNSANAGELYIANPNGGERRLDGGGIGIAGYSVSPYNYLHATVFAWSPDSSKLVYPAEKNGIANLWSVGVKDAAATALTANSEAGISFYSPIWSSDGKRIAVEFIRKADTSGGETVRGVKWVDAATGAMTDVYQTTLYIRLVGWTADETALIVSESDKRTGLPPETILKRIAIIGGAQSEILRLKNAYFYNIFLAEDRKSIAYAAREQNMDDLWVMPASGGKARKLTANNDSGLYFSRLAWFPDSSAVAFGKQTRFSLLSLITDIE